MHYLLNLSSSAKPDLNFWVSKLSKKFSGCPNDTLDAKLAKPLEYTPSILDGHTSQTSSARLK